MADYKFLKVESHDEGRIVRILLDRPSARNAQNRGLLVELDDDPDGPDDEPDQN